MAPLTTSLDPTDDGQSQVQTRYDVFSSTCPSRLTLEHVTGRWGTLVLTALNDDDAPLRFNALRRRVSGVSQKILAQTLQALERDGFVHREMLNPFPPHVEYSLTPLGQATAQKLQDLISHIESHMPKVLAAQSDFDRRPASPDSS